MVEPRRYPTPPGNIDAISTVAKEDACQEMLKQLYMQEFHLKQQLKAVYEQISDVKRAFPQIQPLMGQDMAQGDKPATSGQRPKGRDGL